MIDLNLLLPNGGPALWGLAGAAIYAAPRWLACKFEGDGGLVRCTLDALVCLAVGTLAAAAFAPWALDFLHQKQRYLSAIAAMIGLLANPTAPRLVEKLSAVVAGLTASRVEKIGRGDER